MDAYHVFQEVARRQSFAGAAEALHLTPSAVSHSISGLEDQLGFRLFSRSRGGVQLTGDGERMLVHVREIIKQEQMMQEEASRICGLEQGIITIGTFSSILINWLTDIIKHFQKDYPAIDIHVLQGDYEDVEQWARNGEVDIGFAIEPLDQVFKSMSLMRDRLMVLTDEQTRPEDGKAFTADELHAFEIVSRRKGYNKDAQAFMDRHLPGYDIHFRADDDRSIFSMVEQGFGVAIMPEMAVSRTGFRVKAWPIQPLTYRNIALISRKDREYSPAEKRFVTMVNETMAKQK